MMDSLAATADRTAAAPLGALCAAGVLG